jgi:hypothetical protein
MGMTTRLDIHHPDIVEAFAAARASIDGKLEQFNYEKTVHDEDHRYEGVYEGYMYDASELLNRAGRRITAFDLFDRLDPSVPGPATTK